MPSCKSSRLFSYMKGIHLTTAKKMHSANSSRPFTITVEGNIGSGKTTFLNHFKNDSNVLTISEPMEQWQNLKGHNLINLLYSDMNKWGFTFQTYVQLTMTKLHELKTEKSIKIMERSLFSARYCFVENMFNENIISHPELVVLDEWFKWIVQQKQISCDLIVYLRTDPEVAYNRILQRDRIEEKSIAFSYIKKLHECHELWLNNKSPDFKCPAPVLTLNANKDLKSMEQEYQNCRNEVELLNVNSYQEQHSSFSQ